MGRKYTLEQYNKALYLRENTKLTYFQIAEKVCAKKRTVISWIREGAVPREFSKKFRKNILKASKVASQNRTKQLPNKAYSLSSALSYVLGVIKGDGCISGGYPYRNRKSKYYVIRLGAIDRDFVQNFRDKLFEWCGFSIDLKFKKINIENHNDIYYTQLYSNEAAKFLKEFDISKILNSAPEIKAAFLRGFFDSEGTVYLKQKDNRNKYFIAVFNTNKKLLDFVKTLMIDLGFKAIYSNQDNHREKTCYVLSIHSKKEIARFNRLIKFSIRRKQDKVAKILSLADGRGKWPRK